MSEQNPGPRPPLVPRPVVSFLALGLLVGMFYTLHLDATRDDFEGGRYILMFGFGVFAVLGYDISRFFRNGGGRP